MVHLARTAGRTSLKLFSPFWHLILFFGPQSSADISDASSTRHLHENSNRHHSRRRIARVARRPPLEPVGPPSALLCVENSAGAATGTATTVDDAAMAGCLRQRRIVARRATRLADTHHVGPEPENMPGVCPNANVRPNALRARRRSSVRRTIWTGTCAKPGAKYSGVAAGTPRAPLRRPPTCQSDPLGKRIRSAFSRAQRSPAIAHRHHKSNAQRQRWCVDEMRAGVCRFPD